MTRRYTINLADLAPALKLDPASLPDIQGLTLDSRQVQPVMRLWPSRARCMMGVTI